MLRGGRYNMNRQKILEFVSFLGTLVSVISLFLEKGGWGWQKKCFAMFSYNSFWDFCVHTVY